MHFIFQKRLFYFTFQEHISEGLCGMMTKVEDKYF